MAKSKRRNDLSSTIIKAGHRVYFVDAKVDSEGNRFVAISELKSRKGQDAGQTRERHRILIYEEDMPRFLDAMGVALTALAEDRHKHAEDKLPAYKSEVVQPTSVEIPSLGDIVDLE